MTVSPTARCRSRPDGPPCACIYRWPSASSGGAISQWRDCHFADAPSPSLLKHPLKVRGWGWGGSRMTASPTARYNGAASFYHGPLLYSLDIGATETKLPYCTSSQPDDGSRSFCSNATYKVEKWGASEQGRCLRLSLRRRGRGTSVPQATSLHSACVCLHDSRSLQARSFATTLLGPGQFTVTRHHASSRCPRNRRRPYRSPQRRALWRCTFLASR